VSTDNTLPGPIAVDDPQGKVMNTLLRMIVPLRREFGRNLDVKHFMHDFEYRQDVLDQAMRSQDTRLREYAEYVQRLMSGPRTAAHPPAPPAAEPRASIIENISAPSAESAGKVDAKSDAKSDGKKSREDELRDQIMRKYTTGLR
jgi:hypothetical protein